MKMREALIDAYRTEYDDLHPALAAENYAQGLWLAQICERIIISVNGTWTALHRGEPLIGYTKLGYHLCTADFLRGLFDGDAAIVDQRAALGFSSCGHCGCYRSTNLCTGGLCPQCGSSVLPNIEGDV